VPLTRIVSIDGGGVRALVALAFVRRFEAALGAPLGARVELLAGVSAGSIVAAALALGMSAERATRLILALAPRIFARGPMRRARLVLRYGPSAPRYAPEPLADALREVFGEILLGRLTTPIAIPVVDGATGEVLVLRSDRAPGADVPIWEACAASSSAPTYFPAHRMRLGGRERGLIDGGVGANNPAALALAEVARDGVPLAQSLLVSIGTGARRARRTPDDLDDRGLLEWAPELAEVFLAAGASAAQLAAGHLLPAGQLWRFQAELADELLAMDANHPAQLRALEDAGSDAAGACDVAIASAARAFSP
jgi:patatin-like phospholipase/acyl hydrolase